MNPPRKFPRAAFILGFAGTALAAVPADAAPGLLDYKYFRALSIDLLGRMPTRKEVAAFRGPGFSIDQWLDEHLAGPDYAERLTRIWADLLRLQLRGFTFTHRSNLSRIVMKDAGGNSNYIYFRPAQKRSRNANNGGFCLNQLESGIAFNGSSASGTPIPVTQEFLDLYTTVVKPWWLYSDYQSKTPQDRYASDWAQRFPGYSLQPTFLKEVDGVTDTTQVRVCKEEASALASAPKDDGSGAASCLTYYGQTMSSKCGCGQGLEWCMPTAGALLTSSNGVMLGVENPMDQVAFAPLDWQGLWLYQEPIVYMKALFRDDGDVRQLLTGRHTYVNGPLAQFYRGSSMTEWADYSFNYFEPPALLTPESLPKDVSAVDSTTWRRVDDRGPNAAGVLTMPAFLWKFGTRRSRAHVVYNAFLCKDFVLPLGVNLAPSNEPNLAKREGCAACHQTLEPLAAYFSRVVEGDWNWLDAAHYPLQNPACKKGAGGVCTTRYDPAFATANYGVLRGSHITPDHAEAGPAGLAKDITDRPDFARCVAKNVATSFLGRDLRTDDDPLMQSMVDSLTSNGYRVQPMVRALLRSDAYKSSNNLTSSAWRKGGAQ